MNAIEKGFCQCGCGQKTNIAKYTHAKEGTIKGEPVRYIHGHRVRTQGRGVEHYNWKGGRRLTPSGYVIVLQPDHPRAHKSGYVNEHIIVAEKALGKPLPPAAVVHHVNERRDDNTPSNLVICQDKPYHALLHRRMRAQKACGNPAYRKCKYCQQYDDPARMYGQFRKQAMCYHRECYNAHRYGGEPKPLPKTVVAIAGSITTVVRTVPNNTAAASEKGTHNG